MSLSYLQFVPQDPRFSVGDIEQILLITKELKKIRLRESTADIEETTPGLEELLDKVIPLLDRWIDYDSEDDYGEPPLSAAERHHASWCEHQEAHSSDPYISWKR